MEDDPNYYLTRGYPGSVNTYVFSSISTPDNNSYPPTNEETFIGYMHLSMYYNQARLAEVYPADKYPFLTEKFAFVQKYLKEKYHRSGSNSQRTGRLGFTFTSNTGDSR